MDEKEEEKLEGERADDEINLLDYLIVLAKRKRMIVAITLAASIITALYSLLMPKIYKADISILSPGKSDSSSSFRLNDIVGMNKSFADLKSPSVIIGLLKSKTIHNRIIDRFDLMNIYGAEFRSDAQKKLSDALIVYREKMSTIITISVINENPELAADMANTFVEELKIFLQTLAITEASQRRLFFEEQLKHAKETLINSEETMKKFQEKTGVIEVKGQAKVVIESIANMRALIAAKEVELRVMKSYLTANNPDLQLTKETLKGLKAELAKLVKKDGSNPNPLMPTGRMPDVNIDYIRHFRNLKFSESLYEIMVKQYEMARLDEAKDSAIIQIIDKAVPPENRFKPHRSKMVMRSAVTSFFFSLLLAFSLEFIQKLQSDNNENRKRIATLKRYISFRRDN